jgi:cysteine-rich repeat protein
VGAVLYNPAGLTARQALDERLNEPSCRCPTCGDAGVQWEADEKCDDGNTEDEDGCDSSCKVEPLYLCTGPATSQLIGLPRESYKTRDTCIRIGSSWVPYGQVEILNGLLTKLAI